MPGLRIVLRIEYIVTFDCFQKIAKEEFVNIDIDELNCQILKWMHNKFITCAQKVSMI